MRRVMLRFGLRVIEARQAVGLTQEQLAELVGLSRRQMNRVEAGTANITLETLAEISLALQLDPQQLFTPPRKSTTRRTGRPQRKPPASS